VNPLNAFDGHALLLIWAAVILVWWAVKAK
jgi:hypothetical protein